MHKLTNEARRACIEAADKIIDFTTNLVTDLVNSGVFNKENNPNTPLSVFMALETAQSQIVEDLIPKCLDKDKSVFYELCSKMIMANLDIDMAIRSSIKKR